MTELLSFQFMRYALLAGLIVSVMCGAISNFVVLKRLSFLGAGISHAAFGGVAPTAFARARGKHPQLVDQRDEVRVMKRVCSQSVQHHTSNRASQWGLGAGRPSSVDGRQSSVVRVSLAGLC